MENLSIKNQTKILKNQYEIFNQLCDRAKEMAFVLFGLDNDGIKYFDVCELDEQLIKMTPIEQILYIGFEAYNFICADFTIIPIPQMEIKCQNNLYRVDFLIESYCINGNEIEFKKPLIIECDGFDYHSKKSQMNNDYERENNLKLSGYEIIRFTGSQIFNNPKDCVMYVVNYIKNQPMEAKIDE